jgi:hypothetical protein
MGVNPHLAPTRCGGWPYLTVGYYELGFDEAAADRVARQLGDVVHP